MAEGSDMTKKPWELEGVSERTWYRRQRAQAIAERARKFKVQTVSSGMFQDPVTGHVYPRGPNQLDVPLTELELREYLQGAVPPFRGEVGPLRDKDGERLAGDRGSNPKSEKKG
jgi:hypothetical protein